MGRAGGIAQVGASPVIPQLVGEGPLENKDLLAAAMTVALKATPRGLANNRGGPGYFTAAAIQHPPLDPCHRGRHPRQGGGVQHGALVEIGVEVHGCECAQSRAGAWGGCHCGVVGCQPSLRFSLQSLRACSRLSSNRFFSSGTG